MGVGVPVRQGEPLSWLYTQRGHLTKQVIKRERKFFVFIHGKTPEMEMHPQTGKLFKRKAAASSNLASRLMQTHRSAQPGKGRRREPPSAPGPGGKPCPPVCLSLENRAVCRATRSRSQHHLPHGIYGAWTKCLITLLNFLLLQLHRLSPGLQSQGT